MLEYIFSVRLRRRKSRIVKYKRIEQQAADVVLIQRKRETRRASTTPEREDGRKVGFTEGAKQVRTDSAYPGRERAPITSSPSPEPNVAKLCPSANKDRPQALLRQRD